MFMLNKSQHWLLGNAELLSRVFEGDRVFIDTQKYRYIIIEGFPLPTNWLQSSSRLLMKFPKPSQIFTFPPDHFYLNKGLKNINGQFLGHYFEGKGFNDLSKKGYARFSLHIEDGWHPTLDYRRGTNLIDVLDMLHDGMYRAAQEE